LKIQEEEGLMSLNETPEESIYTVNFRKAWITPEYKRTNRVVGILREFAKRHMKTDDIKIDQYLNRYLWQRGKRNPPRKIRVRMTKDETDTVVISLYEEVKERKLPTEDLEVKQEVETPEEQLTNESKEAEAKEQVEPEGTPKKEDRDSTAIKSDGEVKKEPELKTVEKPKRKSTRKKKSVDQES
jgi:large subunit ribosomal protein L31e